MRALGEVTNPTGRLPAKEFDNRFRFHTAAQRWAAGMEAETPPLTGGDRQTGCFHFGNNHRSLPGLGPRWFGLCGSQTKGLPSWPGSSASGWRLLIFHGAIVQRENTAFARRQRGFESHWLHHFRDATKLVCGGMAEMAYSGGLENRRRFTPSGGSNPPPSAICCFIETVKLAGSPRAAGQMARPLLRMAGGVSCHAAGRFHRGGGLSFSLCSRSPWRAGKSR